MHRVKRQRPFWPLAFSTGAVAGLVAFWRVLLGYIPLPGDLILNFPGFRSTPVLPHAEMGDLVTQFFPWHRFSAARVRSGHLPAWNSHMLFGSPWLANMQSALFSPFAVPFYLLPAATAWSLEFPLRIAIGTGATALLCRRLGAARGPALVAGLAFALGGYAKEWGGWPHADGATLLPVVLLALFEYSRRPTRWRWLATVGTVAALLLSGHPQTVVYAAGVAGLFAIGLAVAGPARGRSVRFLAGAAWAALLAAGVAAVQLLPTMQWLARLRRSLAGPPGGLSFFPVGHVVALVGRQTASTPTVAGTILPETAGYLGIITVVGAILALRRWRRWEVRLFGGMALVSLATILSIAPFPTIYGHLPGLRALPAIRLWFVVDWSVAVLASIGLTEARADARSMASNARRNWLWWAVPAAALAALLALLARRTARHGGMGGGQWLHDGWSSVALAVAALLLVSPNVLRALRPRLVATLMVLLAAVDLLTFGGGWIPVLPSAQVFPYPAVYRQLRSLDPGLYRTVAVDNAMPGNAAGAYGLDGADGYDYIPDDKVRWLDGLNANFVSWQPKAESLLNGADHRIDLLNVRYLLASDYNGGTQALRRDPARYEQVIDDGHLQVFRDVRALPRAWLVPAEGELRAASLNDAISLVRSATFDPTREVALAHPVTAAPGAGGGTVAGLLDSGQSVRVDVNAAGRAVLVLSQYRYPGWRVTVDGHDTPLLAADGILDGVRVGPGPHHIVFTFRPSIVRTGELVSLGSLVVIALTLTIPSWWRRRAS